MKNEKSTIVRDKADWAIGYENSTSTIDNLLLIAQAKRFKHASIGIPQIVIYMAAAQEARKLRQNKNNLGAIIRCPQISFFIFNE